jgi:hypothetical protein
MGTPRFHRRKLNGGGVAAGPGESDSEDNSVLDTTE